MTAPALGRAHRIEVDAPDGAAALELERRLSSLLPTAMCRHDRWLVDVAGVHSVDEVEEEVRTWLRQIGAPGTTVRVDGRPTVVAPAPRGRYGPTHADFVGWRRARRGRR